MSQTKKIYFENLDGLRFLCFLSVFLYHSFETDIDDIKSNSIYYFIRSVLFSNGNLGVNFFFVLSGFLITYLLIEEKRLNGKIHILNFWIRRILRIWPLYFFCVLFGFFIFPLLKSAFGQVPNETANIWYYLTFTSNFEIIKQGYPDAALLTVLWSVAVEEQFYLVWPVILYFFSIKRYWIVFSTVIVTSITFRYFNNTTFINEFHTLSCIGDMAIGAFGAWLILTNTKFKTGIENLKKFYIYIIYLAFMVVFIFRKELLVNQGLILSAIERSLIAIIILGVILEQCFAKKSFYKMCNFKVFSYFGKVSYGLYCLHFIGILVALTITKKLHLNVALWQLIVIVMPLSLLISIVISLISYNVYEKPFLKLKNKFAFIKTT